MRRLAAFLLLAACVAPPEVERLSLGDLGIACGRVEMGREVAQFPPEGRARWRIYDTAPGATGPRAQFVTGFDDGCARQVQAALVVFGAPRLHETLRYGDGAGAPWSETDAAYERVKARICGVGQGTPCPAGRAAAMEGRVAFVTYYDGFDGAGGRTLLLSDGALVAQSAAP